MSLTLFIKIKVAITFWNTKEGILKNVGILNSDFHCMNKKKIHKIVRLLTEVQLIMRLMVWITLLFLSHEQRNLLDL